MFGRFGRFDRFGRFERDDEISQPELLSFSPHVCFLFSLTNRSLLQHDDRMSQTNDGPEVSGPWLKVAVTPLSGDSVLFTVDILPCLPGDASPPEEQAAEEKPTRQRQQLSLAPRSKPVASNWEMGAGGDQWGGLNVDASRKKKRCAECTRPLPLTGTSLLCERCDGSEPSAPAAKPPLRASPPKTAEAAPEELADWELLAEEDGPEEQAHQGAPKKKVYSAQYLMRFQVRLGLGLGLGLGASRCVPLPVRVRALLLR